MLTNIFITTVNHSKKVNHRKIFQGPRIILPYIAHKSNDSTLEYRQNSQTLGHSV